MSAYAVPATQETRRSTSVSLIGMFDQQLLAPTRTFRQLERHLSWAWGDTLRLPLDVARASENAGRAREWLAMLPDEEAIKRAMSQFEDAVVFEASAAETQLIVAAMIDAFPNAKFGNPDTYVEAVALALLEDEDDKAFSATVLAATVVRLLTKSRFVPNVAEVLTEAKAVRHKFYAAFLHAEHLLKLLWSAQDVLIEIGEIGGDVVDDPDLIPF